MRPVPIDWSQQSSGCLRCFSFEGPAIRGAFFFANDSGQAPVPHGGAPGTAELFGRSARRRRGSGDLSAQRRLDPGIGFVKSYAATAAAISSRSIRP